jgi:hypothetical protein
LGIESFILHLVVSLLTYIEFKTKAEKRLLSERMGDWKNKGVRVMAGVHEMEEENLIRLYVRDQHDAEVDLRKKAFTALVSQVSHNFNATNLNAEADIKEVYSKFNSQTRLRRAVSAEDMTDLQKHRVSLERKWEIGEPLETESERKEWRERVVRHRRYSYPFNRFV